MKHLASIACLILSFSSYAQRLVEPLLPPTEPISNERTADEVLAFAEQMPEFEGGEQGLKSFLAKNILYPETAAHANIEGTVYVQFVVSKDSTISHIKLLRGINGAPDLDKEALRVVKLTSGKWKPGRQNGQPVHVRMNLPVKFRLQ